MTKLDAGLITSLPASDPNSAAVWGSKRINPRPQFCLCLAWSGCPSNDDGKLELLDLRSNEGLRDVYKEQSLLQFYSQLQEETYPVLLKNARFWIAQFGSTYRCEQGFSVMKLNKSKLRSQLTDGHLNAIMRIAITPLKPNFASLAQNKRLQKSSFG